MASHDDLDKEAEDIVRYCCETVKHSKPTEEDILSGLLINVHVTYEVGIQ